MADQEQLEILRQGVPVWNAWRWQYPDIKVDLQRADLHEADLRRANLQGVILREANLYAAKLGEANLCEADLRGTKAQWANLTGANLYRANLYGANLQWTALKGVILREANLTFANLAGAELYRATLYGSDLTAATLGSNIFGNLDLRGVQGLDAVQHYSPSTIGLDTIELSRGQIPEVFLRGCGISEHIIEYLPSLTTQAIDYYSCFISYSHADKSFARRLHDALQGQGIRCWLDEHQLLPGHSVYDEIDRGIRLWDKILLCASEHSLKSWWVDNELNKAFTKEQQLMKQHGSKVRALIPLNLDDALWQWQDGKADEVRSRLAADFTAWEHDNAKFELEFERLVKALQTNEGREEPPKPKLIG